MSKLIENISSHLEFLGYKIEPVAEDEDTWVARGGSKPEVLLIQELHASILLRAAYPIDDQFSSKDANNLNIGFIVSRCVFVEDKVVSIECALPLIYDKKTFGAFFDVFKGEVRDFLEYAIEKKNEE